MQLTDLTEECRNRVEDYDELLSKISKVPDKNTLALPYTMGDVGSDSR